MRAWPDLFMKELRVRILKDVDENQVVKILPALWRVREYLEPGLPRPTMNIIVSSI